MRYRIEFKPRAVRDLRGLSTEETTRVLKRLEALEIDLKGDVKKLTSFTPEYRLRVGPLRVLFEIEESTVVIYRILHRKEVFR